MKKRILWFLVFLALIVVVCCNNCDDDVSDDINDDSDDDNNDSDDSDDDNYPLPPKTCFSTEDSYIDPSGLCPPNFVYYEAGFFKVVRTGNRWGSANRIEYDVVLVPFCLALYESAQPTATPTFRGEYFEDQYHDFQKVPPAQVCRGVLPWNAVSWHEATSACQQQGWRLPIFEELQFAMTSGNPDNIWGFGGMKDPETQKVIMPGEWNCRLSEYSWFETCQGPREMEFDEHGQVIDETGITGGPFGTSNYLLKVYDLLGNLAEWTATPWDLECYDATRFSLLGQSLHSRGPNWENRHNPDPSQEGCWLMCDYGEGAWAEHEHEYHPSSPGDDGFRCVAEPSSSWLDNWENRINQDPRFHPSNACYYDHKRNQKRCYSVPLDPNQEIPHILD